MSDSICDLIRTNDLFSAQPDWIDGFDSEFKLNRDVLQVDGGLPKINEISDYLPNKVNYNFTNLNKENEYYITNFFEAHYGKCNRFWVPIWYNQFTLDQDVSILSTDLYVTHTDFNYIYQGYERIFIKLKNGDLLTRWITAVTLDDPCAPYADYHLTIQTAIDRNILITDVAFFGLLLLARFDIDELEIPFETDRISEFSIPFVELINEYSIIGGGS
jgi:hypothetical protein